MRTRAEREANTDLMDEDFVRLVQEHARLMYRLAYGLLRHAEDAEDAVQDALLKLYRTGGWRQMQDAKAFLARTVWRTAYDRLQARVVAPEADAEMRLVDARATPEQEFGDAAERALLQTLIDGLPEELRQTLLLSAMEELNSREIGLALGVPEGTVRTRLMRARAELRRLYETLNRSRPGETAVAGRTR